ncbi:MAG: DUF6600 domain-containing protein [Candidatus Aminicenantia bacterium]
MRVKVLIIMMVVGLLNLYSMDSAIGRISYIKGDVYIQRGQDLGFESATINFPVTAGDRIATSDGMTEIYIGNANYIRLDRDTKLDVLALSKRSEERVLRLWTGNIYLSIKRISMERDIEVQMGDVSVYVIQPGIYRIDASDRTSGTLFVIKGAVEAQALNGNSIIRSNQSVSWEEGELGRTRTYYASNFDEFDDFNESRESLISRTKVQRYLPSDLYDYEWELDYYGRWHYLSSYGWVWVPPHVFYDWRPYYWGRWVWYPWGWTWVPYEPWGWVTFHYGRWQWHVSIGWYWVPTTIWGPAWVHWTWGDYWIGWCPIDIYNRPVIIVNNYWVTHYHDSAPSNSSSFVFIRKEQLMARDVRNAVLEKDRISKLGAVPIYKSQPDFKPTALSPIPESYKGKIMLKNPEPLLNENHALPSGNMIKSRLRSEDTYPLAGKSVITPGDRVQKNYREMQEIREREYPVKRYEGSENNYSPIERKRSERGTFQPSAEPVKPEDFRSIERRTEIREQTEPFYNRFESMKDRTIRNKYYEENQGSKDFTPFFKRRESPPPSETRGSSSIKDVFKPFSGSRSPVSSRPSDSSIFRAPSPSRSSSTAPSPRSSYSGKSIKKKGD